MAETMVRSLIPGLHPRNGRLYGSAYYTLDSKCRIVVPLPHRQYLGDPCMMTRGAGGSLLLFPWDTWLQVVDDRGDLPGFGVFYVSGAFEVEWQREKGRVTIPIPLREHAGLRPGVEVAVAGCGRLVVIARPEAWDAKVRAAEELLFGEAMR